MNTKRIIERNEIAKAIYLKNTILTESVAYNSVQAANEMMAQMYGRDWADENDEQQSQPSQPAPSGEATPIVSIAEQNGEKGVRLCVGDVDIFIEAHNIDNGEEFEWKKAMARLEEVGKRTFDKHEMYLITAYKDEINAKLKEIDGDELDGYYWSSTEYNSNTAWYVHFSDGYINTYYVKYHSLPVRPCAAFIKH
jgi:hypothetical protein